MTSITTSDARLAIANLPCMISTWLNRAKVMMENPPNDQREEPSVQKCCGLSLLHKDRSLNLGQQVNALDNSFDRSSIQISNALKVSNTNVLELDLACNLDFIRLNRFLLGRLRIAYIQQLKLGGLQRLCTLNSLITSFLIQSTNAKAHQNSNEIQVAVFLDEFQCVESFEKRTDANQLRTGKFH